MSRGKYVSKLCPECETRERATCRGNGRRATCGDPECIKARKARLNPGVRIGAYGERLLPQSVTKPKAPDICERCGGYKWFNSFDGVTWEGCYHCEWGQPVPLIYKALQVPMQVCTKCGVSKSVKQFSLGQAWCMECKQLYTRKWRTKRAKPRICPYCGEPVYRASDGHRARTCGSAECKTRAWQLAGKRGAAVSHHRQRVRP